MRGAWADLSVPNAAKLVLFACATGAAAGLASVLLCVCVDGVFGLWQRMPWLVWLLPVAGVLEVLLYRALKLPAGSSTESVVELIQKNRSVPPTLAPGILAATCLSVGCGASVGKEAGALQMGASLGSLIARPFRLQQVRLSRTEGMDGYASALGMAACFSALFFAPLGSCAFAMELSRFKGHIARHLPTVLLACFVAFGVASAFGIGDVIMKVEVPVLTLPVVGQCILIGACAAVAGGAFSGALRIVRRATLRACPQRMAWAAVGGLVFACLMAVFSWQGFAGTGGDQLNAALTGAFAPEDFAVKALLTLVCLGCWIKGGQIMPALCIGGLLGAATSIMTGGAPPFAAAVGAMSFFAAFARCPLAAFLMGCEIFGFALAPHLALGVAFASLRRPSANGGPSGRSA